MAEIDIPLRHTALASRARLRDIGGHAELAARSATTSDAIRLIDEVLVEDEGALPPGSAADLPAADRDRILGAIYRSVYGDAVESTVRCRACDKPFDISFSLTALGAHITGARSSEPTKGTIRLADGRVARLPVGRDECAVIADGADGLERRLAERCLDGPVSGEDTAVLAAAMQEAAPLLTLELASQCPECGHAERVDFDIQSFLLGSLVQDRRGLYRDIHSIAHAYHWSLDEILSLPRTDRRALVAAIDGQVGRAFA
jgi:hypothetical protein